MSNIIPFTDAPLPAAVIGRKKLLDVNKDIVTVAQFPSLSIKGKVFTLVQNNERKVLTKPDDADEVLQALNVAFLRVNMASKTFYKKKFTEDDAEWTPPDCASMDGIKPDAHIATPQAKTCAVCPNNQWGSRVSDDGESKGKACADHARIAIADPRHLDKPMLLRVPPASLKALKNDALKVVKARQLQYNEAVFRIGFDREAASPKLTFKPVGLLDDASYSTACEQFESEIVRAIVGADPSADVPVQVDDKPDAPVDTATGEQAESEPKVKPAVKAEAKKVEVKKAEPKPEPKPVVKKPVVESTDDDLLGDLDSILGGKDD